MVEEVEIDQHNLEIEEKLGEMKLDNQGQIHLQTQSKTHLL